MPTSQNGQTPSSNSSTVADELFKCVWPICGVGAWKVKDGDAKIGKKKINDDTNDLCYSSWNEQKSEQN